MTMGCGSSKKIVNESPSDLKVKTTLLPEGNSSREVYSSGNKNNGKRKIIEGKVKGAKFRARFDSRVTEKYAIKALIGKGSFSKVVRVEDRVTKQPYAIKMIEIQELEGKDVFQSELAVLRKVQHSYIVRLFEVFECKDKVYLVMELATGGELFDRIVSRGHFTEWDATHVLYMVLEGVRYLHSLGITHRDLKPENLVYYHPGNESKIMITDFGLSNLKKSSDDSTMETTCGTPEYIAPEILMSKPYTNSVDMWSIGVISYILLSGAMPFSDDNRTRLYRAILMAKYNYSCEPWNDVSNLAKDFINKLLLLEPEKRMTAEEGLKHPWITSLKASSTFKNLHGSFCSNWLKSSTSRLNSAKSNRSKRSSKSSRSGKSVLSKHRSSAPSKISDCSERHSTTSTAGATAAKVLPDSSKLKSSHLKLTRQLVEKLQSVAKEESGDSPATIKSNASSSRTSTIAIQHNANASHKSKEIGTHHLIPIPSSSHVISSQVAQRNFMGGDSPMTDIQTYPCLPQLASSNSNCSNNNNNNNVNEGTVQFPSLQTSKLSKLAERDEEMDNQLNSDHSTFFTSTFDPSREITQRNNFFDESPMKDASVPMLLKPFAMEIDCCSNDGTISSNSSVISTSPARTSRFRPRTSPNAKRNKVSSSF